MAAMDSHLTVEGRIIRKSTKPKETLMRRTTFLKSMTALAATAGLPLSALASTNTKMMIPANPAAAGTPPGARWARRCRMPRWPIR